MFRKLINMVPVLAVLVLSLGFSTPVHAQFTCAPHHLTGQSPTVWPNVNNNYQDCQRDTVDPNTRSDNATNLVGYITGTAQTSLFQKYDVHVYLFTEPQDMFTEIIPKTSPTNIGGFDNSTSGETYAVVGTTAESWPVSSTWELNKALQPRSDPSIPGKSIRHEFGHQADRLWALERGYKPVGGVPVTVTNSDKLFQSALAIDQANLQKNPDAWNAWNTSYPYFANNLAEFFAEQYANQYGGGTESAADGFMSHFWPCTFYYLQYYTQINKPPANLTATGALATSCVAQ